MGLGTRRREQGLRRCPPEAGVWGFYIFCTAAALAEPASAGLPEGLVYGDPNKPFLSPLQRACPKG